MSTFKAISYLFQQTSRDATPNAPPYDPTRKVKSWVDPSPTTGIYQIVDTNGNLTTETLSIAEASTLNLPGHPDYPKYAADPTKSAFAGSPGNPLPFGVSSLADAQRFVGVFGLTNDAIFDMMSAFPGETVAYDPNDPRRCYGIKLANGTAVIVADLLKQEGAAGVGAPGEWKQDASGNWAWVSELAPDPVNFAVVPVPIVPLAANEQIVKNAIGIPEIEVDDPTPAPSTGGSFDAANDPTIQHIMRKLDALLNAERVPIPA